MKIGIVLGTRAEIIKLYSTIKECENRELEYFVVHTGQHYDNDMSDSFFDVLELPYPKYNLERKSGELGDMISNLISVFEYECPDVILVQGDTDSVLAGGLACKGYGCKLGHIESGLRSYDLRMPEEKNRIIVDQISNYLFCPTHIQYENLVKENIKQDRIYITGNTVVDCLNDFVEKIGEKQELEDYIYLTLHRPGNVDDKKKLHNILNIISKFGQEKGLKVVFSCHPRTHFKIQTTYSNIEITGPQNYLSNLNKLKRAKAVFTDSGGLQEESSVLGIPCIVFRPNTERPEGMKYNISKIFNTDEEMSTKNLINIYDDLIKNYNKNNNLYGDGSSGKKILDILTK